MSPIFIISYRRILKQWAVSHRQARLQKECQHEQPEGEEDGRDLLLHDDDCGGDDVHSALRCQPAKVG